MTDTPLDTAAIESRLAKITPGPWTTEPINSKHSHDIIIDYDIPGEGSPFPIAFVHCDEEDNGDGEVECRGPLTAKVATANAAFIAAAPADTRALLDENKRLAGEVAALRLYREAREAIHGAELDAIEQITSQFNDAGELHGEGKWRLRPIYESATTLARIGADLGRIDDKNDAVDIEARAAACREDLELLHRALQRYGGTKREPDNNELMVENERLRMNVGTLLSAINCYLDCRDNHPQIAGEARRDLNGTIQSIESPELEKYGWPEVYDRLRAELDALHTTQRREGT